MIKLKKIKYLCDYKLKILFSDGKTKIVDFEEWIFEDKRSVYLVPLSDLEFFKKFDLDESKYTICWPNGADFCPDVLYAIGKEVKTPKKRINCKSKKIKPYKRKRGSKARKKANL